MPKANPTLGDSFLIEHCFTEENCKKLGFVTAATELAMEEICNACSSLSASSADAPRFLDTIPDKLDPLWSSLLMDAIHALKLRDRREKAGSERFFEKATEQKLSDARESNVYGITDLKNYFSAFAKYERVLYGAEVTYRDHVVHVIRTWLIGVYLLTVGEKATVMNLSFDCPVRVQDDDSDAVMQARELSSEERWAMWTVVALCHDLGYPLEKTHMINDVIEDMLLFFGNIVTSRYSYSFQTQHQSINDITLRILASKIVQITPPASADTGDSEPSSESLGHYATKIQAKYYTKLAHSLEEFRHGIISCLVLMKTLVYFLETDFDSSPAGHLLLEDARQFYIRREILRAIASHTCTDIYHLEINTLAFLLIVCDELQEWGRPTLHDMKLGRAGSGSSAEVRVKKCNFTTGEFTAEVHYRDTRTSECSRIKRKFQDFHKLMRPAPADARRTIKFEWKVVTGGETFQFKYNSGADSFDELITLRGKDHWDIYGE